MYVGLNTPTASQGLLVAGAEIGVRVIKHAPSANPGVYHSRDIETYLRNRPSLPTKRNGAALHGDGWTQGLIMHSSYGGPFPGGS